MQPRYATVVIAAVDSAPFGRPVAIVNRPGDNPPLTILLSHSATAVDLASALETVRHIARRDANASPRIQGKAEMAIPRKFEPDSAWMAAMRPHLESLIEDARSGTIATLPGIGDVPMTFFMLPLRPR